MNFNLKDNSIHVNLLKLALALQMDPEMARLMKARTRERVEAMAARIKPLVQAADATVGRQERKQAAALAEVRARQTLKQMQLAVLFQYPVLPEAFSALGRMRLGITPGENLTRLQAIPQLAQANVSLAGRESGRVGQLSHQPPYRPCLWGQRPQPESPGVPCTTRT